MQVAAVSCPVDQRPQGARRLRVDGLAAEQRRACPEQDSPAQLQPGGGGAVPPVEKRRPGIFQCRQLGAADAARDELLGDRDQPRLGRRLLPLVERFEPLAPPCQADRAEPGVGAGGNDVGQRQVEAPQGEECGADAQRQLLKRDIAIIVERSLSDR